MNNYPQYDPRIPSDTADLLQRIVKERKTDVNDFNNLTNVFIRGRKVDRIPSSSSDLAASDKVNDINWTDTNLYILIDVSGTPEWRTAALSSF